MRKSKRRSLLVLLGAGASAGYLPSTNEVTDDLTNWPDWSLVPSGHGGNGYRLEFGIALGARPPGVVPFYKYLLDSVSPSAQKDFSVNFEDLIDMAATLGELLPSSASLHGKAAPNPRRPLWAALVNPSPALMSNGNGPKMALAATQACYRVLKNISQHCDKREHAPTLPSLVRGLRRIGRKLVLNTFSLNYDDMPLWQNHIRFRTGFVEKGGDPQPFDPGRVVVGGATHTFYQMHGSVRFALGGLHGQDIVQFASRLAAGEKHWLSSGGQSSSRLNAPMITGRHKTEEMLREPFASYHHAFWAAARQINRWLIIGYGGQDQHINQALTSARRLHGSRFRCVVINFHDANLRGGRIPIRTDHEIPRFLGAQLPFLNRDFVAWQTRLHKRKQFDAIFRGKIFKLIGTKVWVSLDGTDEVMERQWNRITKILT